MEQPAKRLKHDSSTGETPEQEEKTPEQEEKTPEQEEKTPEQEEKIPEQEKPLMVREISLEQKRKTPEQEDENPLVVREISLELEGELIPEQKITKKKIIPQVFTFSDEHQRKSKLRLLKI
jgi:hypothetical protein